MGKCQVEAIGEFVLWSSLATAGGLRKRRSSCGAWPARRPSLPPDCCKGARGQGGAGGGAVCWRVPQQKQLHILVLATVVHADHVLSVHEVLTGCFVLPVRPTVPVHLCAGKKRHFDQIGGVSLCPPHRSDDNQLTTRKLMLANEIFLQNALREEFPCPTRGLDRFAENSNIPWNQPNILHPNQTAEVPRMHLLSPCVSVVLQYHLSQTDEALKYNDATKDLHKSLHCPVNSLY